MASRPQISVVLAIAVVLWAISLKLQGIPLSMGLLAPFGAVVGGLGIFTILFEHKLWHLKQLQPWLVNRPDLRGTWRVHLQSSYVHPDTGKIIEPIYCYMSVTQSFSTLQMRLMTRESNSWLIASSLAANSDLITYQVAGAYTNKPLIDLRADRSSIHLGAFVLQTHGVEKCRPTSLDGEYWTDRKTNGTLLLSERVDTVYTRFDDAEKSFADIPN